MSKLVAIRLKCLLVEMFVGCLLALDKAEMSVVLEMIPICIYVGFPMTA